MPLNPEQQARIEIDRLLTAAGWHVCGVRDVDLHAARGVAVREFPLKDGHGFADYLLYVDGRAAGVIEAKKAGVPLIGVEHQAGRYANGLPEVLPAWSRPFSTGSRKAPVSSSRGRCSPSSICPPSRRAPGPTP